VDRRKDDIAILAGSPEGEASLVGRIAAGDRRAFEMLYRAYFPRLARFLHRMTRNSALIEEIANDTMLVVWQKAATFNGSSKVSTWVFAIAYRRACKALNAFDEPVDAGVPTSAKAWMPTGPNGNSSSCAWRARSTPPSPHCRWRSAWPSS
jgi:hypothetical protein